MRIHSSEILVSNTTVIWFPFLSIQTYKKDWELTQLNLHKFNVEALFFQWLVGLQYGPSGETSQMPAHLSNPLSNKTMKLVTRRSKLAREAHLSK